MVAAGGGREEMEKDFEAKLRLEPKKALSAGSAKTSNIAFRAPQENFTIQDFELGRVYGVGSYSKVVSAKKKDTGDIYAMKIMDKKFITKENKAFNVKLERIVLDQLDHPGIVRIFFTFQDANSLYMALEPCEGGDLFDQITRIGHLPDDLACFYLAEVIDALEYVHGLGLIHRDIKPENLLLTADGHIKLADFGSVKPTEDCRITVLPDTANEKMGTFIGTAGYVPPEVLNASPATFGNDLWALGCTLYQMLSGSSPFKDASEWLTFQRIKARDLRFPEYFSDEASDLIDKLLDTDHSRRLGAGPDGYSALKFHPFFKGIDWKNLRAASAPRIDLESNDAEGSLQDPTDVGDGSIHHCAVPNDSGGTTPPSLIEERPTKLISIDSFDSRWQEYLEFGESVVMISTVKKLHKLTSKKVQLILTDKPKLIYVDPSKFMENMKVIWSDSPSELSVQVANSSHFKICTQKKVMSFEDSKERAWQWKKAVEGLVNH